MRNHLLGVITEDTTSPLFIVDDCGEETPIPVFSNVTPNHPTSFLLHIMLMMGEFYMKLDLQNTGSMKQSFALCKLIPSENLDDEETLRVYSQCLLRDVVTKVLPVQLIAMRRMEEFIVKCKRLFDPVLLDVTIPITELPPVF